MGSRRDWYSLFDLMEEYHEEHPEATDEEVFEAVCYRIIPERIAARYDYVKDQNRDRHAEH